MIRDAIEMPAASFRVAVSLIICTRNRSASLRDTLRSIEACEALREMPTELVVVDNGSTDRTREVVEQAGLKKIAVRYIHEPRDGQCHARNRGLAESSGEVILFTDDDVRVPKNWIEGMCQPLIRGEADAVAGGVEIGIELQRAWMEPFHRNCLAGTEWLADSNEPLFVGANMAFSRRVLETVPAFDTELGPGALGFYDEMLFARQLKEAGFRVTRRLETAVLHLPEASRLSRSSYLKTAEGYGRSQAYIAYHWEHAGPRHAFRSRARASLRLLYHRARKRRECMRNEGIADWEFQLVREWAFYDQSLREMRRPKNYKLRGLVKQTGEELRKCEGLDSAQALAV